MKYIVAICLCLFCGVVTAADIEVDFSKPIGKFRALHGVNGGPINHGGTIDLTKHWKELQIPLTRLHDCDWPTGRVVDMHSVFPSLKADPANPASYNFTETDDYLAAIHATGAKMVYRLGENIEHSKRKYHVHPPSDYDAWSAAAVGIVRHYNEGWASGQKYDIRYWEIWNEPENRPSCWSGTDEDYYRLYVTAAKALKKHDSKLKVGGPAVGASGEVRDGKWQPTEFMTGFLKYCKEHDAPLDFFSWHTYTDDASLLAKKSRAIRAWLDEKGFKNAEQHLNEWNYLPDNSWAGLANENQGAARTKWYEKQRSPAAAAFIACSLIELQDAPLDVANFFTGVSGDFGLFTHHGEPTPPYYALWAMSRLQNHPVRAFCSGSKPGEFGAAAGYDVERNTATIVLANYRSQETNYRVRVAGWPADRKMLAKIRTMGESPAFTKPDPIKSSDGAYSLSLKPGTVCILELSATAE